MSWDSAHTNTVIQSVFIVSSAKVIVWWPLVRKAFCGILWLPSLLSVYGWTCSSRTPVSYAWGVTHCQGYWEVSLAFSSPHFDDRACFSYKLVESVAIGGNRACCFPQGRYSHHYLRLRFNMCRKTQCAHSWEAHPLCKRLSLGLHLSGLQPYQGKGNWTLEIGDRVSGMPPWH